MPELSDIAGYHAHVYYDEASLDQASYLCETAAREFGIPMGRMHEQPVGPHPMWSCQLTIKPSQFGKIIPWLNMYREGLTILVHPETGDDLWDHRDGAMWLGASRKLNLAIFGD